MLIVVWAVSLIAFVLLRAAPSDAAVLSLPDTATEEQIEAKREEMGLNDPYIVQYGRYMLDLIRNGYVYLATPPLYLVKKGKEEIYCWTDDERRAATEKLGKGTDKGVTVQRYKGLGEMSDVQLWETTMDPSRRLLRQVTIDNAAEAERTFSMLMGDDVPPRREFIEQNAHYANVDA